MMKSRDYGVRVYKDSYNDWVCEYIDIPGLIGVGNTMEEAVKEAQSFLHAYLDELDKENSPYPVVNKSLTYSGRITLRVSKPLHLKISCLAQDYNVSINQFLTDAINTYIGETSSISKFEKIFEFIREMQSDQQANQTINLAYKLFDESKGKSYYTKKGLDYVR